MEKASNASHQRQPKLIARYVGDRFEWVGYVYSVSTPKTEQDPLMIELGPDDHAFRPGSTVRCVFPASAYGDMIDNLKLRRRILVAGVMTADGHLENCRLLMTMNPAGNCTRTAPSAKGERRPPAGETQAQFRFAANQWRRVALSEAANLLHQRGFFGSRNTMLDGLPTGA